MSASVTHWYLPDQRYFGREDSTWYSMPESTSRTIIRIYNEWEGDKERSVEVRVDGTLHVDVYTLGRTSVRKETVTEPEALYRYGIMDDESLIEAFEDKSPQRFEWVSNTWWTIYFSTPLGYEGGEEVFQTLSEAVDAAYRHIESGW